MDSFLHRNKYIDVFFVLLVQILLYCNVFHYDFVWDDNYIIKNGLLMKEGITILDVFKTHLWKYTSLDYGVPYYRPLTVLTFLLQTKIFGDFAGGYHMVNVFLHLANVFLVWVIAAQLGFKRIPQLVATLFYSLHPTQIHTVSFISSQGDILCMLFILLSITSWIAKKPLRGLSIFFALIAMLCKEAAALLPIILFCFDTLIRKKPWNDIPKYLPFLLWIPYGCLRMYGLRETSFYDSTTPWIWNSLGGYRTLLLFGRILFPIPMPPEITIQEIPEITRLVFNIAYASLVSLCVYRFRKNGYFLFFVLYFFISILVVGDWMGYKLRLSDQFLYIPLLPFSYVFGHWAPRLKKSVYILPALFLIYAVVSAFEIQKWKNSVRLWASAVEHEPNNPGFNLNLAMSLRANGFQKESCDILEYCIKLLREKNEFDLTRIILTNYGSCKMDQPAQAQQIYESVLKFDKTYYPARLNLIESMIAQKHYDDALANALLLVEHSGNKSDSWKVLGFVYDKLGNNIERDKAYAKAEEVKLQH